MPHKEEAVDVLRNVPEFTYNNKGVLVDSRKKHLMELQYAVPGITCTSISLTKSAMPVSFS